MATSTALILIAGMSAVTYLTRLPLVLFVLRRRPLPPLADRILDRIPIAADRKSTRLNSSHSR